jgi:hypothetical protein
MSDTEREHMSDVQAWEYCEVDEIGDLFYYDGSAGLRVVQRADEIGDPTDAYTVARRVAQLGALGWELVNVARYLDEHSFPVATFYFKRPLANPDLTRFERDPEIT